MTHINTSAQTRLVVRLAKTAAELKAILKVRYEVMRDEFPMYVPENSAGLDIDQWDVQSYHLGLWVSAGGREVPIGYMRVIQTNPLPVRKELNKIVEEYPCLEQQYKWTSKNPIRFLDLYNAYKEAKIKYDMFPSKKIVEASRLSMKKEYRELNPGRFMVESAFALFFNEGLFTDSFMEIREKHLAAYYRYGFRQVALRYVQEDSCNHILCYAHYSDLPAHLTGKLSAMREEYRRNGVITFMPQMQGAN